MNNLLRIAIIIPRLEHLGPVKVMQALVNSLHENKDLYITVFYIEKRIVEDLKIQVPVMRLIPRKFPFSDFDIIHTNGIRPDLFAFINRKKIKYHISTIHNFVFEDLSFTYNRLISLFFGNLWLCLWKKADKLVCVSDNMCIYYQKWFSSSQLEVVHNGISLQYEGDSPDGDIISIIENFKLRGLRILGTIGILTRRKGIDQILLMMERNKETALIIIGDGREIRNLQSLAKKLGITERCHFCGYRINAINYMRYFDFFIMPSRSEGFSLTMLEAAKNKVRVICSDLDVFKEFLNPDEVTFFKLEDINSLSAAIKESVYTGIEKAELAYLRFKNEYTDGIMASRYLELYKSAV